LDVEEQIDRFFEPLPEPGDLMLQSLNEVFQELDRFIPEPLQPLSCDSAAGCLPANTSPGFPYTVTEPGKKKGELLQEIVTDYKQLKVTRGFRFEEPCSAGVRLALAKKPKNKPRLVWVYPATVQLSEAKFFIPIYSQLYACRYFAWDFSFLRGENAELEKFIPGSAISYGIDISKFDASVHRTLIKEIFKWMKSHYSMTKQQNYEYDAVEDYFINTPLWYKKSIFMKRRGVPSGSFFTQLVDSIVNLAIQVFIYNVSAQSYRSFFDEITFLRVLGDDSLVSYKYRLFNYEEFCFALELLRRRGFEAHPEKGFYWDLYRFTKPPEFLGFQMPSLFSNIRSPILLKDADLVVAQCLFPEQKEKHPGISLARLIGIKWSCGDCHEAHDVVDFFHSLFSERHADVVPTDLPTEFRHLFQFVFGRIQIPVDRYPTTQEVVDRYLYCNEAFSKRLASFNDYRMFVYESWRPMSFAEIRNTATNVV